MQGAACCYTKALKLSDKAAESAVLYRNRSACYLKLEEYSKAETDATKGRIQFHENKGEPHAMRGIANHISCITFQLAVVYITVGVFVWLMHWCIHACFITRLLLSSPG